jgi:hypothetical protein
MSCQQESSDTLVLEYFKLDQNLKQSNQFVQGSIEKLMMDMDQIAASKTQYLPIVQKAHIIFAADRALNTFIDSLRQNLIEETGGYYTQKEAIATNKEFLTHRPKGAQNVTEVKKVLFSNISTSENSSSKAMLLGKKIQALCHQYNQLFESCWVEAQVGGTVFYHQKYKKTHLESFEKNSPLHAYFDDQSQKEQTQTWANSNFKGKSLAAILPILRALQNDMLFSKYTLIQSLRLQFYNSTFYDETLDILAQSSKSSIRLGDTYEAEIALGAYFREAIFEIIINGDTLNQMDGKAIYRVRPKKTGEQSYKTQINYTNPLTGETTTFSRNFYFEVIP